MNRCLSGSGALRNLDDNTFLAVFLYVVYILLQILCMLTDVLMAGHLGVVADGTDIIQIASTTAYYPH